MKIKITTEETEEPTNEEELFLEELWLCLSEQYPEIIKKIKEEFEDLERLSKKYKIIERFNITHSILKTFANIVDKELK